MPKKLPFDNPIRVLRNELGKTQVQFAVSLGISRSMLQKLELGKRKLKPALAAQMMVRFGVRPQSLTPKRGRPLPLFHGNPGTLKEQIEFSRKPLELLNDDAPGAFRELLGPKLEILMEAASRQGRAVGVAMLLDSWIEEQAKAFRLWPAMQSVHAERKHDGREATWGPYFQSGVLPDGTIRMRVVTTDGFSMETPEQAQPAGRPPTTKNAKPVAATASPARKRRK